MVAEHRLYLTSDRLRVVFADNPEAAFLLAAKGTEIPREFVHLVKPVVEPVPEIEARETRVVTNRRRR